MSGLHPPNDHRFRKDHALADAVHRSAVAAVRRKGNVMAQSGKGLAGDRAVRKATAGGRIDGRRADTHVATPFAPSEQSIWPQPADMVEQVDRLIACASDALVPHPTGDCAEIDETPPL